MHEAGNDFTESITEESISEVSTCTLTTYSPLSDLMESDSPYEVGQVIDPLRFPLQNDDEISPDLGPQMKKDTSADTYRRGSSSSKGSHNSPKKNREVNISSNPASRHSSSSSNTTPKHSSSNFSPHTSSTSSSRPPLNSSTPYGSSSHSSSVVESRPSTSSSRNANYVDKLKSINLSELECSLPASQVYEPETVDFPSSPTRTSRSLSRPEHNRGVRLAEGDNDDQKEESQGKTFNCATGSNVAGKVNLRKVERPKSLEVAYRKRLTVTDDLLNVSVDDDLHSVSSLSYNNSEEDDDAQMHSHDEFTDMLTPDDIETPDELEESIMEKLGPVVAPLYHLPPQAVEKNNRDETTWRSVVLSGIEKRIDMKVIEPYKKVLSHGGYMLDGNKDAIIVFSACFLPDRSRRDYDYVMDHLFIYLLTTLDQLIEEDYILVYLHGATTRGNMPSFAWLKRCYQMIDRRLRKNLQGLYLVHPTFWVKTVIIMARPFVSSKFSRKLRFISNLKELSNVIPLDQVCIPSRVKQYDEIRESLLLKKE